jgi:hypothetical protein
MMVPYGGRQTLARKGSNFLGPLLRTLLKKWCYIYLI